jgi:hypothetical protein
MFEVKVIYKELLRVTWHWDTEEGEFAFAWRFGCLQGQRRRYVVWVSKIHDLRTTHWLICLANLCVFLISLVVLHGCLLSSKFASNNIKDNAF